MISRIFSSLIAIDYEIILENTRNSKISLLHNIRHLECSNTLDPDLQHIDRAFQNVAEKISLQIMACASLVVKQEKLGILILKAWFPYGRKHVVTVS